jgi:hypothetical protein
MCLLLRSHLPGCSSERTVMRSLTSIVLLFTVFSLIAVSPAQEASTTAVPNLINYSGTVILPGGPGGSSKVVGVTFAIYRQEEGGAPLWLETQNVMPDSSGHYSVLLGSTKAEGIPADLFHTQEQRWLGVQVQGEAEQRRVLLASVPYAVKAGDAQTVGGLPASAFVLAAPSSVVGSVGPSSAVSASTSSVVSSGAGAITGSGTAGFLPEFTGALTIGNSAVFQSGASPTAKVGINTSTPTTNLDVNGGAAVRGTLSLPATGTATAAGGKSSQPENLAASVFNSGTSAAVTETFQLKAEPVGNDTATASGSLNLLFGQGPSTPAETGFKISSKGVLTFASGQTFPGTGTVRSVGSGAGLTGGPITTTGTLSIANAGVTNTMLAHPTLTVAAGTDLSGGGAVALGGTTTLNLDTTKVPQLNTANTFTGNQTVNGNLSATGVVTGNSFNIGSDLFAFGSPTLANAFLGFAGNTTTTGTANTASGPGALSDNTTGSVNTASGLAALASNTTGSGNTASGTNALITNTTGSKNTASGYSTLYTNTTGNANTAAGFTAGKTVDSSDLTGSNNTAIGAQAWFGTGSLTNATAIGAFADVTASNSVVLGSINGVNGATADTSVGIGTTAPVARLHIGPANSTGLRIEGPKTAGTGAFAASFGGFGNFNIDAPGIVGGRFSVRENGQVTIGGTAPIRIFTVGGGLGHPIADGWDSYSSRRWKTNIQTLHGALGKVEKLRGVSYELKDSGTHQIGVIAEEVGAVVPEVVTWEKNGKDAQGVDYGRLTALLIEATKEQEKLIRQQQKQIQAQEEQIRAQQAQSKLQQAEITRLSAHIKVIQASLSGNGPTSLEIRPVKAAISAKQ